MTDHPVPINPDDPVGLREPAARLRRPEILAVALVLVAAHHAIPDALFELAYRTRWMAFYELLGQGNAGTLYDALQGVFPLILCLAASLRSGLRLGDWRGQTWKVLGLCAVPVALVAAISPFTSQPFAHDRIGCWLVSPASQDLLFSGYLYGLLAMAFPARVHGRLPLTWAMLLTAMFFSAWHTPNFLSLAASFVAFQLLYTFLFGLWFLIPRRLTGSILPGILCHMASNFVAWKGW